MCINCSAPGKLPSQLMWKKVVKLCEKCECFYSVICSIAGFKKEEQVPPAPNNASSISFTNSIIKFHDKQAKCDDVTGIRLNTVIMNRLSRLCVQEKLEIYNFSLTFHSMLLTHNKAFLNG